MKKIAPAFVSFIVAAMLIPMTADAEEPTCQIPNEFNVPTKLEANGHYYQAIPALNIGWGHAKSIAEGMTFDDPATPDTEYYPGHLAIITTAAEDCFIEKLRAKSYADTVGSKRPEYWVGASQDVPNMGSDKNWNWIIPEAPFDNYTNWQDGEPNDAGAGEAYLGIGHTNVPGWNDEANVGNIGGYIVEFDVNAVVIENLENCRAGPDGLGSCDTTPEGAQKITIPDAAIPDLNAASLTATTYRLTDNPDRCGVAPLELFNGALIISPNHCATSETGYEFIVVFTEATGIDLQEGTIRVVQDAKAALLDFPYRCDPSISLTTSPNDQEIVIYQRTDKARMREDGFTWGNFTDDGSGATADITDSCGSSRGRRGENSWSVIGMVQNFGPGSDFGTNRSENFRLWNELVIFKLHRLIEAIDASSGALRPNEYNQIHTQAQRALQKFTEASYSRASSHLRNLLRKVEGASYTSAPGENNQGEAIERAGAIKFMIEVKVETFEAGSM